MKEKLKESSLKPGYDNAMLEGAFIGDYPTIRYQVVKRRDGLSCRDYSVRSNAENIGEKKKLME